MRVIVSDAVEPVSVREGDVLLTPEKDILPCLGCYHCWIRTPGVCVQRDSAAELPALLGQADELVLISRLVYGGFSPFVKRVLDRSLGYLLPFFEVFEGTSHHPLRYPGRFSLKAFFYGGEASEQDTARELLLANARNLEARNPEVFFAPSEAGLLEVLRADLPD